MIQITYHNGLFVGRCQFSERMALKRAGFAFERAEGIYRTPSRTVAARLREYWDSVATKEIDRALIRISPWLGRLPLPPCLSLMPHQIEMARFALSRNRSYLAADPGTGKTPTAATIINAISGSWAVYVCPPFLTLNVEEELLRWRYDFRHIRIYGRDRAYGRTVIVPDSRLDRLDLAPLLCKLQRLAHEDGADFVLIVDEAHRFNGPNAIRSLALYNDFVPLFDKVVFMSGTPMQNRPMDLYNVLSELAPETINFMDRFEFGRRYCAGKRNAFGWDFKGASNVKELAKAIRPKFMLRVKADVLKLPPLRSELIFVGDNAPAKVTALEASILRDNSPEDLLKPTMSPHVSTYRKELGALKVAPSLPFIKSILDHTDEAFLLGCIHRDVVAALKAALAKYRPLVIDGSVKPTLRQGIAKEFQTNPKRRFIIMNLEAGGIGLNLMRASRIVLLEYSWVPAVNKQFIGRALRYGQKRSVLAQYMVFRNSLDRKVLEAGFRKEAITRNL